MASSDHNAITFKVNKTKIKYKQQITKTTRKYNTKKANWNQFNNKLEQIIIDSKITEEDINKIKNKMEIDTLVNKYIDIITKTCTETLPKIKNKNNMNLPWWSKELAGMKKEVTTRKRRIRCAAPVRRPKVVAEYLQAKEKYELEAKKAQVESWKEFCKIQDKDNIWDGIYRCIGKVSKKHEDLPLQSGGRILSAKESAELLAVTFYPEDDPLADNSDHQRTREAAARVNDVVNAETHDPPFTIDELHAATNSFNPKKAPGSDGLTADICKKAIDSHPGLFLSLANKCLELGHFPTTWKEATVIILRKPAKEDYTHIKSYRPIGLLPVMGKILEKMVVGRVRWHLHPRTSLRQFGFMPQRSTEDSLYVLMKHIRNKIKDKKIVVIISLDIEGAFDSAWWPAIRVRLAEEDCPVNVRRLIDSYLESRKVKVRYAGEESERWTSKGCVQGSIGGPTFWNLLLDPLLSGLDGRGCYCQAFADDVVLAFDGEEMAEIQRQANETLAYVRDWGVRNKLKFAPHKTKAMVLTRKLKYDSPILHMGGVDIGLEKQIKILGVTIDSGLTFRAHISEVCRKALSFYNRLSGAARLQWGLGPEVIKLLYKAVVEPLILYAASVWAPAAQKLGVRKQLAVVQRGFAQKLTKAYRTVSLNSALLLAGILPLDIRARENASLYEVKRGYSLRAVGDREVERPVAFEKLEHPAQRGRVPYQCVVDGAEVNQITNAGLSLFTDGSKIQGKVGAAVSVWENAAEQKSIKLKLEPFCTVYQAELAALHRAVEEVVKSGKAQCSILSDSRAALETVASGVSLHPLAFETNQNLHLATKRNQKIQLFWIKAHAGLQGNERADELAKDAALKLKARPHYDKCPVSFVKRQIRKESIDEWNGRYVAGETASTTKLFFPDAVEAYNLVRKIAIDPITTQVFTGHGGFSEYLNRFKCKESPACICDPAVSESIVHALLDCPVHIVDRFDIEQELEMDLNVSNISRIISDKDKRFKFISYCKKIACKVINRNK